MEKIRRRKGSKKFYMMVGVFGIIIISTITFRSFIKDAFVHDSTLQKVNSKNQANISE